MRRLNRLFLGRNSVTDCLSFNLSDVRCGAAADFEIIVNGQLAARQAKLRGHSGQAELFLYIVHGLLHNLGFDDAAPAQAARMHRTEDNILRQLGLGRPFSGGTHGSSHKIRS